MTDSYFEAVFPDQAHVLKGKKTLTQPLRNELGPLLQDVAQDLDCLCTYASSINFQSRKAKNPTTYINQSHFNQSKYSRMSGRKRILEVAKALLGLSYADVSHRRVYLLTTNHKQKDPILIENSIDWYVQPINLVNALTGEIDDDLAFRFRENCIKVGYPCALYAIDNYNLACAISIPTCKHSTASEIAIDLINPFPEIDVSKSSLYGSVPLPLSKTRDGNLCTFVNDLDGKKSLATLFADSLATPEITPSGFISDLEHQEAVTHVKLSKQSIKTDWVVERAFRQQLVEQYGDDKIILTLIGLFLFSTFRDKEDEAFAVVDTDTMLQILNKKHSKKNLISSNLKRLERLIPIETKRPFYIKSQATSFKIISPPDYMLEAQNQHNKPKLDPVLLSDGKSKQIKKAANIENLKRTEESTIYPNEISSKLISYLNHLPSNSFQARVNESWTLMNSLAASLTGESKINSLAALSAIQQSPKPIYSQGPKTVRIYAAGGHYQNLKRHIRELAFRDCLKLDLRHSQLSIAAHVLNSPLLLRLCESGEAWDYLTKQTGMDKQSIKEFVYFVLFNDDEVIKEDELKADLKECFERLNKTPEIEEFLNLRTHYLIHHFKSETMDAFGNLLKGKMNQKFNSLISSIELSILSPGIEFLIEEAKRTKIVLWLHDGFYLTGSNKETISNAKKTIEIVNQKAKELKIPTSLILD